MDHSASEHVFASASKGAVVGASEAEGKLGTLVFKKCLDESLDVVAVNPFHPIIQGQSCLKSLRDLPDPSNTTLFITVPPKETLKVLREAHELGVPSIWVSKLRADEECTQYIKEVLGSRCFVDPGPSEPAPETNTKTKKALAVGTTVPATTNDGMVVDSPTTETTSATQEPATKPANEPAPAARAGGPCEGIVPNNIIETLKTSATALKRKGEDLQPSAPKKAAKLDNGAARCPSMDEYLQALDARGKHFVSLAQKGAAVVGASDNLTKTGAKIFKCFRDLNVPAIPVNPNHTAVQGTATINSLSELPNPKETVVSISTHPAVTLGYLEEAKRLDIPMLWLQPGAEDKAVRDYIASSGLEGRVVYTKPYIHSHPVTPEVAARDAAPAPPSTEDCEGRMPSLEDSLEKIAPKMANTLRSGIANVVANMSEPCLLTKLLACNDLSR